MAAVFVATMLMSTGTAAAEVGELYAKGVNPFDGIVPDFAIFGAEFNNAWRKILAGLWAIAFVIVGAGFIRAIIDYQSAKKGGYAQGVAEKAESAKSSAIALGALSGLPIIVGAIISVF
ncbi:hypothetical protein [Nocardia sp. CY41]|uniref:hypothetical protein n=1 Tax=Nocardia sp. CY41 TaxID=2608686 RepID=UPI001F2D4346|nr:hypothetical protein [Nocardia sp. CY41]